MHDVSQQMQIRLLNVISPTRELFVLRVCACVRACVRVRQHVPLTPTRAVARRPVGAPLREGTTRVPRELVVVHSDDIRVCRRVTIECLQMVALSWK